MIYLYWYEPGKWQLSLREVIPLHGDAWSWTTLTPPVIPQ